MDQIIAISALFLIIIFFSIVWFFAQPTRPEDIQASERRREDAYKRKNNRK